jgi:hypothetical protein
MQINVIRGAAATGKTRRLLQILDEVGLDESALIHGERIAPVALERTIVSRLTGGDTVICIDDCSEETLEWLSKVEGLTSRAEIHVAISADAVGAPSVPASTPLTALRDALYGLDRANWRVEEARADLSRASLEFESRLRALGAIWAAADEAAARIGEALPETFREGDLLISIDCEDYVAQVERLPAAAETFVLFQLAERAGEHPARTDAHN